MRLFFGIRFDTDTQDRLAHLVERLRLEAQVYGLKARWTPTDNLHLTLRFLGSVDRAQIEAVRKAGAEVSSQTAPFEVHLKTLGSFPNEIRPLSLWCGVEEGLAELQTLSTRLEVVLGRLGWKPDPRGFQAHITLARIKNGGRLNLSGELKRVDVGVGRIERLTLFQSLTLPEGAIYRPLDQWIFDR